MRRWIVGMVVVVTFMFSLSSATVLAQDICEGDFDGDLDQDGFDAALFKTDFGRNPYDNPCPSTTTTIYDGSTTTSVETTSTTTTIIGLLSDPMGDCIGPLDLIGAKAELYDRGDQILLRISIESNPRLPGAVLFECDVDDSTGTGGGASILGAPVVPCPCKIVEGMDIRIYIFTRMQGDTSSSALCASCSDNQGQCAKRRRPGEWYAITSIGSQPNRKLGVLRGLLDPLPDPPSSGQTQDSYTLPWEQILAFAYDELRGYPQRFNNERAMDSSYNKWQISIWYDPYPSDQDDIVTSNPYSIFDLNDWAPNDGKANMQILTGSHNLCY